MCNITSLATMHTESLGHVILVFYRGEIAVQSKQVSC